MGSLSMHYIDSNNDLRITGLRYEPAGDARKFFERFRHLDLPDERRDDILFLMDLRDDSDDIVDTIRLDAAGFREVTGEGPESEEHYVYLDVEYWSELWAEMRTMKQEGSDNA